MRPCRTTYDALPPGKALPPFRADELRGLVPMGDDESFEDGFMLELQSSAVRFVETSVGCPLVATMVEDRYPCWGRLELSVQGTGGRRVEVQEAAVTYYDEDDARQTLAQSSWHLATTADVPAVAATGTEAPPKLSALEPLPVAVSYRFSPGTLPPVLKDATANVFRALFESRAASVPFDGKGVLASITSLLAGYRTAGARYA